MVVRFYSRYSGCRGVFQGALRWGVFDSRVQVEHFGLIRLDESTHVNHFQFWCPWELVLARPRSSSLTAASHLFSSQPLDYETKRAYTLTIEGANTHPDPRFTHLGPFKDTTTLKIIVGDVDEPPVFPMDYYIMDVYENAPPGTDIGVVSAQDPDNARGRIR